MWNGKLSGVNEEMTSKRAEWYSRSNRSGFVVRLALIGVAEQLGWVWMEIEVEGTIGFGSWYNYPRRMVRPPERCLDEPVKRMVVEVVGAGNVKKYYVEGLAWGLVLDDG